MLCPCEQSATGLRISVKEKNNSSHPVAKDPRWGGFYVKEKPFKSLSKMNAGRLKALGSADVARPFGSHKNYP